MATVTETIDTLWNDGKTIRAIARTTGQTTLYVADVVKVDAREGYVRRTKATAFTNAEATYKD